MKPLTLLRSLGILSLATVAVAVAIGQQAPQSDPKVALSLNATPVKNAVESLAQATGKNLKATEAMSNEYVLIHVTDVPASEVMKRLADVTEADWVDEGNVTYLKPSDRKRAASAQKTRARLAVQIAKSIDSMLKPPKPDSKETTAATAGAPPESSILSEGRFQDTMAPLYRILKVIGANQLASVPDGGRAVFSTRPTNRQYAIDGDIEGFALELIKSQDAAMRTAEGDGGDDGDEAAPAQPTPPATPVQHDPPSKVDIAITRHAGSIEVMFLAYDAKGKRIAQVPGSLLTSSRMEAAMAAATNDQAGPTASVKEQPIELSDKDKALLILAQEMTGAFGDPKAGKQDPKTVAAARQQIARPDLYDPLCYAGAMVIGTAKVKDLQVIASLPDGFALSDFIGRGIAPTPSSFLESMKQTDSVQSVIEGPWWTITPEDAEASRTTRADRVGLARLIAAFKDRHHPSLDELGQLAASTSVKGPSDFDLTMVWVILTSPSLMSYLMTQDWDWLRLYGSLDPSQRSILGQNGRLSVGQLSDYQKNLVDQMVFGGGGQMGFGSGMSSLQVEQPPAPKTEDDLGSAVDTTLSMFDVSQDGMSPEDYRSEPTEVAPNGVPNEAYIVVKISSQPAFRPVMKEEKSNFFEILLGGRDMTVNEMAWMLASDPSQGFMGNDQMEMPKIEKVQLVTKVDYRFRLYVTSQVFKSAVLSDGRVGNGETYGIGQIPGELGTKLQSLVAKIKKMNEENKNQMATADGDGVTSVGGPASGPR